MTTPVYAAERHALQPCPVRRRERERAEKPAQVTVADA